MDTKNKVFVVIGSVALIATVSLGGAYLFGNKDSATSVGTTNSSTSASTPQSTPMATTTTPATTPATDTTSTSSASTSTTSRYKDGTYTASTSYRVPHGATNSMSATVVVSGGKITSVTTSDNYTDRESQMWISGFESSVSDEVAGSTLDTTSYSRIGGASLTTQAFDNALDTIRAQAKA